MHTDTPVHVQPHTWTCAHTPDTFILEMKNTKLYSCYCGWLLESIRSAVTRSSSCLPSLLKSVLLSSLRAVENAAWTMAERERAGVQLRESKQASPYFCHLVTMYQVNNKQITQRMKGGWASLKMPAYYKVKQPWLLNHQILLKSFTRRKGSARERKLKWKHPPQASSSDHPQN